MEKAPVAAVWDGRIESLLAVGILGMNLIQGNRRMLDQVQKMVVKEFMYHSVLMTRMDQYPLGSMTSNEDERNRYIISQYKERLDYMVNHSQVNIGLRIHRQIVADGLQPNQEEYGMKRLLVEMCDSVVIQNSLLFSATEYHLESPLWKYIIIHLHDGDYEGLTRKGEDQHFHLSVPYMYDEKELIPFLNRNLSQLKQIYDSKDFVKKISQFPNFKQFCLFTLFRHGAIQPIIPKSFNPMISNCVTDLAASILY